MKPIQPPPKLGPNRPIGKKFITKYNLIKLFEDPENPTELMRVLPSGEPVLSQTPKLD